MHRYKLYFFCNHARLRIILFCFVLFVLQLSVLPQWASATTAGTFRNVYRGTHVTNTEAPSGGEVGQHPGITRIPPPLGTVAPVKPGVFPTWGTCIAGDQL